MGAEQRRISAASASTGCQTSLSRAAERMTAIACYTQLCGRGFWVSSPPGLPPPDSPEKLSLSLPAGP
jgi:hypothetical protein